MTTEVTNGRAPAPAPEPDAEGDLDEVRRQAVALLDALDRPPRTLRIQAGAVTVDLTWPEQPEVAAIPAAALPTVPTPDGAAPLALTCPVVGVFYHAREPGAEPFAAVGTLVRAGQQIGIVEAMKLMIPVEADRAGRISAVLKGNGEPVEYGEPLFALEAEG